MLGARIRTNGIRDAGDIVDYKADVVGAGVYFIATTDCGEDREVYKPFPTAIRSDHVDLRG